MAKALSRLQASFNLITASKKCIKLGVVPNTKSYTEPFEEIETKDIRTQTCVSSKDRYPHHKRVYGDLLTLSILMC